VVIKIPQRSPARRRRFSHFNFAAQGRDFPLEAPASLSFPWTYVSGQPICARSAIEVIRSSCPARQPRRQGIAAHNKRNGSQALAMARSSHGAGLRSAIFIGRGHESLPEGSAPIPLNPWQLVSPGTPADPAMGSVATLSRWHRRAPSVDSVACWGHCWGSPWLIRPLRSERCLVAITWMGAVLVATGAFAG